MSHIKQIIADLQQQMSEAEETCRAARIEWDKARKRQNELLENDPYSIECADACADVRVMFNLMMKQDEKSTALFGAIRAIKKEYSF